MTVHDGGEAVSGYEDGLCGAPTQSGDPCRREVDSGLCWQHEGREDAVKTTYPPPAHLGEHGANLWSSLVDEAVRLGMLTQTDYPIFVSLCEQWQVKREAREQMREEGITIEGGNRGRKANPANSIYKSATSEVRKHLSELGFTPTARTRMDLEAMEKGEEGIGQYMR